MNIDLDAIYDLLDDLGLEPSQRISTLIAALEDEESSESQDDEED